MKKWTIEDAKELYNINGWGTSYFGINDKGDVYVTPCKDDTQIDLRDVMDELALRDVTTPVLLRFPDILDNRIEKTANCFNIAAKEYDYKAENFIIYPIKVNQMQPVVEEIISHGRKFNLGLEAGSKPELHAVIALQCQSDSLIICNGYKDQNYIELALLAQKMGKRIFIVVEKLNELDIIAKAARKFNVKPNLGIRIKLASSGSGKWEESGGDASKFGLTSSELLTALQPAFARISDMGIRYSALPGHTREIAAALNEELSAQWRDRRGLEIVAFGVSSVKADEADEQMIKDMQRDAAYMDPTRAAAMLSRSQGDAMKAAASNTATGPAMAFMGMGMAGQVGGVNAQDLYAMGRQQAAQQPAAPAAGSWTCACGQTGNTGKFCANCGKPAPAPANEWTCECGARNTGKFCSECGKPAPASEWTCDCGTVNKGKFCSNCGKPRA